MKRILLYVVAAGITFSFLKMHSGSVNTTVDAGQQEVAFEEPKMDSPEMFERVMHELRTKEGASGPEYAPGYLLTELSKAKAHAASVATARRAADDLTFIERGPANVPGRTRAVLVYPGDATHNTWFAGSVGGGIWKTTDAGATWKDMTPDFPNLATSTLAMSKSDMNTIYAGTGEGFGNLDAISGAGIFKSTDGGDTWAQIPSTANAATFGDVNRMVVSPTDVNVLVVAFNTNEDGISTVRRSTDGGTTWTIAYQNQNRIQDLRVDPNNFNIQYVGINGIGVAKSTDGGVTWALSNNGMSPGGRVEIAVSPVNTNRLYASAQGGLSGTGSDLYTSADAGATWISVQTASTAIDFLGGQGWYDNGCIAHPFDENSVYVCGVNTFKMTIGTGTVQGNEQVSSVDENGTTAFFDVVNFSAPYFRGGLDISDNAAQRTYVSVELRFGAGRKQMAHRFLVPEGQGSGVPDGSYEYQDYVEVPFEAWDIVNNRQLMVSFRDQQRDGGFNLNHANTDGDASTHAREYIYISQEDYDASGPSSTIAVTGGHVASDLYFLWPILRPDASSDPSTWPTSELRINWSSVTQLEGSTTFMTDAYNQLDGKNQSAVKHPDHHDLFIIIDDEANKEFRIVNGTDGGVYSTNKGTDPGVAQGDWIFTGNGYNTSQFYGADKAPGEDRYIGGMQDNGTWFSPTVADKTTQYSFAIGGDGYESIWHSADINKMIGGSQYNGIARSVDGGVNFNTSRPADNGSGNAPFVTRIANSKKRPDILYAVGVSGIWRSPDFGLNWNLIPLTTGWAFNNGGLQPEVSVADPDIVWAGGAMGATGNIFLSTDNGATFNATNNYTEVSLGSISGLATDPVDKNTAYVTFSFAKSPKVIKTTDLGQTWTDISGYGTNSTSSRGFPDVAVYCLLVFPQDVNRIWAGTEIGIVESLDGGASWALLQSNFPAVSVWQMLIQDDEVVIATHGRGIWSVEVPGIPETLVAPSLREVAESPMEELKLRANFVNDFDKVEIYVDGNKSGEQDNVTKGEHIFTASGVTGFGDKKVMIKAIKGSEERSSNEITFNFFDVPAAIDTYQNDFKTLDEDFVASGINLGRVFGVSGFDGGGIHTAHPHVGGIDEFYRLAAPVTVASSNANFIYDDVAIMEIGEDGTMAGDANFFDYVIAEGSKDGITWVPLEPGYDAGYNAGWKAIYDQGLTPSSSDMVTHNIDLTTKFSAGDVVFLRFRIFADGGTQGWGWAIDNLFIQAGTTTGFEDDVLKEKLALRTYPNPTFDQATIEYFMPKAGNATIEMVDMKGRTIFQNDLGFKNKGLNSFKWSRASLEHGIYILKLHTENGSTTTRVQLN